MKRLQAFKFELMPDGGQQQGMRRFAGARRFVYNRALDIQKANYAAGGKFIGYVDMANRLPEWKRAFEWLKESPFHTLQQSLKDAERAFKNFFEKRAGFPRFKKKGSGESFRFPDAKQFAIDQANSRIKLPKLGWMRFRNSRDIVGTAKNITISQAGGKWFASIQTERELEQPVPIATSAIGIDVGIARFATLSDGSFVAPLCSFKKHEKRLAKYQRRMSRKTRFSKNWHKAKRNIQKVHTTIANARKDFLHKTTSDLSKNHAMVAVEDLQVRNMSRSAAGNAEKPGKNVAAKSGLNKAILDQGWFEFRRQLEYKLAWRGGILIAVPAHHTSQTCPCCGHVAKANRQTQAKFECVDCGYQNHADVVGAMNILARGYRAAACGEDGSGLARKRRAKPASVKQEPTEVTMQEPAHA
ncbi:RNA-guided endonuclease InsQ/TnpB family protein [Polaromonas naphthalenivorans]|uniref:Transposase, IS605 OrfB family n=1 Tax=Polaromonas naphthalenivorans (strain CJ2) TaxID=365044 RepID=A1VLR5_POLNA|nr:RNA-guided endonuclease TnpB family protein [Polaromonas naphthalenivorans]ABM36593.1 transposase, IS605 OrfB family [Polaromonas naphthalenivorans CJ2]